MKKFRFNILTTIGIALAFLGLQMAPASAVAINVFGTGLSASGVALPGGSSDPNYTIDEIGGANAVVWANPLPGTYFAKSATSQWIWENANGSPTGNPLFRTFTTTFDLTGLDINTAVLNGAWGTDNQGLAIILNGVNTGVAQLLGVTVANFNSLTSFVIDSGFQTGLNTLQFVIEDNGSVGGFRTDLSGTASVVPIPAALPLFGTGLAIMGFVGWRRKRKLA